MPSNTVRLCRQIHAFTVLILVSTPQDVFVSYVLTSSDFHSSFLVVFSGCYVVCNGSFWRHDGRWKWSFWCVYFRWNNLSAYQRLLSMFWLHLWYVGVVPQKRTRKYKKGDRTRRLWSHREEEILAANLVELVAQGWKSDNGFRTGYLRRCEDSTCKNFLPPTSKVHCMLCPNSQSGKQATQASAKFLRGLV